MREIEFRVWNEKLKRMFNSFSLYEYVNGSNKFLNGETGKGEGVFFPIDSLFLQFIGLFDKNGKKIFEGDILKIKDNSIWLVEEIGSKSSDGQIGICVSPIHFKKTYLIDESIIKGEVIGNIYENPELLEEQKK